MQLEILFKFEVSTLHAFKHGEDVKKHTLLTESKNITLLLVATGMI